MVRNRCPARVARSPGHQYLTHAPSVQRGKEGRSQLEKEAAALVREALKSEKQAAKSQRKQVHVILSCPRQISNKKDWAEVRGCMCRKSDLYSVFGACSLLTSGLRRAPQH